MIILSILAFIVYAIIAWHVGFQMRKQAKKTQKNYLLIAILAIWLLSVVSVTLFLGIQNDYRIERILPFVFLELFPAFCGMVAIMPIPIPGLSIED